MRTKLIFSLTGVIVIAGILASCKKADPPTAEIFATTAGYKVTFNPTVANADTFTWDFGDGSDASTEQNPVHTYESFGDYTVALTAKGEGGTVTVTKVISIAATSVRDLLTGGKKATNGKTWVFDQAYVVGEGGGPVSNPPYTIVIPSMENVLGAFGLGAEYDNEFTFWFDGKYQVNPKNGNVLAAAVYGYATGTIQGDPAWDIGLCAAAWFAPSSATWTLHDTDLVLEALADPNDTNVPPIHNTVTITGRNWVSLSEGAFFGILDFPTTAMFIIDEITSTQMSATLFVCAYSSDGGDPMYNMMPSNMFHLVYKAK